MIQIQASPTCYQCSSITSHCFLCRIQGVQHPLCGREKSTSTLCRVLSKIQWPTEFLMKDTEWLEKLEILSRNVTISLNPSS